MLCCKENTDGLAEEVQVGGPQPGMPGDPTTNQSPRGMTPSYQELTLDGGDSKYTGQVLSGKRHGQGTMKTIIFAGSTCEETTYEGQWVNDQQQGKGKMTWNDGRSFDGSFDKGLFHGHGRMEWKTSQGIMFYDGDYVKDEKQGRGKFVWPDGRAYDGEWHGGQRHGRAAYTNVQGVTKTGRFSRDKLEAWLD